MAAFKDQWLVEPLLASQRVSADVIERLAGENVNPFYLSDKLISMGYLSEDDFGKFIEQIFHLSFVYLDRVTIDKVATGAVPEEICRKHQIFPYQINETTITIAMQDPLNLDAENEISYLTSRMVKTTISSRLQIEEKINEHYSPERYIDDLSERISLGDDKEDFQVQEQEEKIDGSKSDAPIVRLANSLLNDAIDKEASDIHIEPTERKIIIRFRVDGILKKIMEVPKYAAPQLISRIKVISNLDIAETRKPQDGQTKVKRKGTSIDLRVSILPTSYGEKAVIRILDSSRGKIPFEKLGITGENLEKLQSVLDLKQGIILATGPTGSGKTTTLYAALNRIKSSKTNILTVEDPIEYSMEGINQVQVNEKAGITFASALRSFLRQDPDVILVGEIRDFETAEISIQASLTGHLVLSTLHTNSALETITRLIDLGVDRYKVTSALSAIVAQRLVRNLCTSCREETEPGPADEGLIPMIKQLNLPIKFYKGVGCPNCDFTGFKGRIGIYEILKLDNDIKEKIDQGVSIVEIERVALSKGFKNFTRSALELITSGATDYSEVSRVLTITTEERVTENLIQKQQENQTSEHPSDTLTPERNVPITLDSTNTGDKKRILVTEDDQMMRKLITNFLQKEGKYEVIEACDGEEALKMVSENLPDLMLLDIMMPKLDGYEVCRKLRSIEKYSKLPIIMLTALDDKEDLLKGFNLGVDDYISKPVDRHILIARVNAILRRVESEQPSGI